MLCIMNNVLRTCKSMKIARDTILYLFFFTLTGNFIRKWDFLQNLSYLFHTFAKLNFVVDFLKFVEKEKN